MEMGGLESVKGRLRSSLRFAGLCYGLLLPHSLTPDDSVLSTPFGMCANLLLVLKRTMLKV